MQEPLTNTSAATSSAPYELTLEDREHYLYACVRADYIDLHIAFEYVNEVVAELRKTHHSKALLVRETPNVVSALAYSATAGILVTLIPSGKKIAIVDRSTCVAPFIRRLRVTDTSGGRMMNFLGK